MDFGFSVGIRWMPSHIGPMSSPARLQKFLDSYVSSKSNRASNISKGVLPHACGASWNGKAAPVIISDPTGVTEGAEGAEVASSDDDGDGDGDPDSDRTAQKKSKPRYTEPLQTALNKKRVTTSNRILRMAELKIRVGLSRSTIYEFIKLGQMPRSISLGSRAVGWLESDIDAWLESRISFSNSI